MPSKTARKDHRVSLFTRSQQQSGTTGSGAEPDDDTGAAESDGDAGTAERDDDRATAEPGGDAGTARQEGDAGTTEPDSGAALADADGDTAAAESDSGTGPAAPDTDADADAVEPDGDVGATEPDSGTAAAGPDGGAGTTEQDSNTTPTHTDDDTAAAESDRGTAATAPGRDTPATQPDHTPVAREEGDDAGGQEAGAVEGAAEDGAKPGWFGWRRRHPRAARGVSVGTTVLAGALVVFALLLPNRIERIEFASFVRIPAEGVLLAGLLLALPPRPRRIMAVVTGVFLGLVTVLKFADMGFYQVLARPFDLVLDWILIEHATDFLRETFGRAGQVMAVIGVIVLLVAVLVLTTLAVVRLTNLMVRHRPVAARTTLILGTAWITCMTLGVQIGTVPIATKGNAEFIGNRVEQVRAGLKDARVFEKQAAVDAFAKTPPDQLLTGLRGKDVLFTFIESYGRVAIDDPAMAKQTDAVLKEGTASLKAAGFDSRSGWLQSPVTGAGSWLAHSTFLSGLWIKNQQRYRSLTTSDRMTLTNYFRKTGAWRTVGIVPGVRRAWPEGKYFGLDHIYDSEHLGYHGPYFSWTPVPDQFSMEAFQRLEHGRKDREPIMAEIILASSHNPWSPIARMIDWEDLGDGSVFHQIKKEGTNPTEVWKDPEKVRTEYRRAIEYSIRSLTEWVERYGDEDTVLVFLGDHQPVPTVTAGDTGKDVPITIVARDKKVLDRVADWSWTDGLKPAPDAPRWGMDKFRDRFMTAYGPQG
ncbi:CDP-alcohol phosphatidyltransferase [Streptomyces azureus]|uniref:CDP-alcohol phosphatidyltransferase n=1 Tax=Streptomyces azureus TaxID=146537 RepID=A0A0K8PGD8_STRAJ|nr:CDP-alcohol phosphatidyltransferase [Streptomyces azureus]